MEPLTSHSSPCASFICIPSTYPSIISPMIHFFLTFSFVFLAYNRKKHYFCAIKPFLVIKSHKLIHFFYHTYNFMKRKHLFLCLLSVLLTHSIKAQDAMGTYRTDWMSYLADDTPACRVSIPGVHDAATGYSTLYGVKVQNLKLDEMFDCGIRAYDIRLAHTNDTQGNKTVSFLSAYHGIFNLGISFHDEMQILYQKLKEHPSEYVIVFFKPEHDVEQWDEDHKEFKRLAKSFFRSSYSAHDESILDYESREDFDEARVHWVTNWRPDITVGEMRGKVLFVWDDHWLGDENDFTNMAGVHSGNMGSDEFTQYTWDYLDANGEVKHTKAFGQNYYEGDNLAIHDYKLTKCVIPTCEKFTQESIENPDSCTWCVNLCSGYTKSQFSPLNSTVIAKYTNGPFASYLGDHPEAYAGIILCDYAGDFVGLDWLTAEFYVPCGGIDIVDALVANNRRFFKKTRAKDKRTPVEY